MAGGDVTNGGRVSQRDLYEAILKQNDERADMERRLMDKLAILHKIEAKVCRNEEEIEKLRTRSNVADLAIAIGALIGTAVSAVIGNQK